jgi:hypothetical protein
MAPPPVSRVSKHIGASVFPTSPSGALRSHGRGEGESADGCPLPFSFVFLVAKLLSHAPILSCLIAVLLSNSLFQEPDNLARIRAESLSTIRAEERYIVAPQRQLSGTSAADEVFETPVAPQPAQPPVDPRLASTRPLDAELSAMLRRLDLWEYEATLRLNGFEDAMTLALCDPAALQQFGFKVRVVITVVPDPSPATP